MDNDWKQSTIQDKKWHILQWPSPDHTIQLRQNWSETFWSKAWNNKSVDCITSWWFDLKSNVALYRTSKHAGWKGEKKKEALSSKYNELL